MLHVLDLICFGSAADEEDDVMLKQMTLIAAVVLMEVILVPDFKNAPDPEDISVLRWESLPT